MMRFAVSDSKNHWCMTILDDLDLVANSDTGDTQPEISAAGSKESGSYGSVMLRVYSYLQRSATVRSRAEVIITHTPSMGNAWETQAQSVQKPIAKSSPSVLLTLS